MSAFDEFSKSRTLYLCNMFISRKNIFDEYYKWLFDILFELEKRTDLSNYMIIIKDYLVLCQKDYLNVWLKKHSELKIYRTPVYNIDRRPYNQYLMIN